MVHRLQFVHACSLSYCLTSIHGVLLQQDKEIAPLTDNSLCVPVFFWLRYRVAIML